MQPDSFCSTCACAKGNGVWPDWLSYIVYRIFYLFHKIGYVKFLMKNLLKKGERHFLSFSADVLVHPVQLICFFILVFTSVLAG